MPSLLSSLFTGVSGLQAKSEAMGILGDNISNVNTVGFKSSRAVFSDLFSTILANGSTTRQLGRGSNLLSSLKTSVRVLLKVHQTLWTWLSMVPVSL